MAFVRRCAGLFFVLFLVAGCKPPHINEMTKPLWTPDTATFPELDSVFVWIDPQPPRTNMSHTEFFENWFPVKAPTVEHAPILGAVRNASFQERLKALADAQIPAKYATPEREESRKKYIEEWKNLEKLLAAKAKPEELAKSGDKIMRYMAQMKYVAGQTQPTGDAAKKYASVAPYIDPYKE